MTSRRDAASTYEQAIGTVGLEMLGMHDEALCLLSDLLRIGQAAAMVEAVGVWVELARESVWPDVEITTARPVVSSLDGFEMPIDAAPVEYRFIARLFAAYLTKDFDAVMALWHAGSAFPPPVRSTCLVLALRVTAALVAAPHDATPFSWEVSA
jgi:hypothetical protein